MRKQIFIVFIIVLISGLSFANAVNVNTGNNKIQELEKGNTIFVGGSGPGNYSSIQEGIDNADVGDTVYVLIDSSPYWERIDIYKKIVLKGDIRSKPEISGRLDGTVINVYADEVTITGLNIIWSGQYFSGIKVVSDYNQIFDNRIDTNFYGINIIGSNHNLIKNNIFYNNYISNIRLTDSEYNTVIENEFGHTQDFEYSIYLTSSNDNFLYHNNVYESGVPVFDDGQNSWDDGYPSGGNYWAYFLTDDENDDGICDNPKDIPGGDNSDQYPLFYLYGQGNMAPNTPKISGPTKGKVGELLTYKIIAFDPEQDDVYYKVWWGDSSSADDWIGPFKSGEEATATHTYNSYYHFPFGIAVSVKDENGNVSPTNGGYSVYIEKSRGRQILNLLDIFEKYFPLFFVLKNLL